ALQSERNFSEIRRGGFSDRIRPLGRHEAPGQFASAIGRDSSRNQSPLPLSTGATEGDQQLFAEGALSVLVCLHSGPVQTPVERCRGSGGTAADRMAGSARPGWRGLRSGVAAIARRALSSRPARLPSALSWAGSFFSIARLLSMR